MDRAEPRQTSFLRARQDLKHPLPAPRLELRRSQSLRIIDRRDPRQSEQSSKQVNLGRIAASLGSQEKWVKAAEHETERDLK